MTIDRLRREPLWFLPALLALLLAATALPAGAEPRWLSLCSGGSVPMPAGRRDCDRLCHIGCDRHRRPGQLRGL